MNIIVHIASAYAYVYTLVGYRWSTYPHLQSSWNQKWKVMLLPINGAVESLQKIDSSCTTEGWTADHGYSAHGNRRPVSNSIANWQSFGVQAYIFLHYIATYALPRAYIVLLLCYAAHRAWHLLQRNCLHFRLSVIRCAKPHDLYCYCISRALNGWSTLISTVLGQHCINIKRPVEVMKWHIPIGVRAGRCLLAGSQSTAIPWKWQRLWLAPRPATNCLKGTQHMGHHSRDLQLLRLAPANHTYTGCPPPRVLTSLNINKNWHCVLQKLLRW